MLKPQDIVLLLKLVANPKDWTYRALANELELSIGELSNIFDRVARSSV